MIPAGRGGMIESKSLKNEILNDLSGIYRLQCEVSANAKISKETSRD